MANKVTPAEILIEETLLGYRLKVNDCTVWCHSNIPKSFKYCTVLAVPVSVGTEVPSFMRMGEIYGIVLEPSEIPGWDELELIAGVCYGAMAKIMVFAHNDPDFSSVIQLSHTGDFTLADFKVVPIGNPTYWGGYSGLVIRIPFDPALT